MMTYFRIRTSKDLLQKLVSLSQVCHGGYEAQKNVLFQKFDNNLIVICPLGMASTHLDTATKMYWFPNELEKGPIKSIP